MNDSVKPEIVFCEDCVYHTYEFPSVIVGDTYNILDALRCRKFCDNKGCHIRVGLKDFCSFATKIG